MPRTRRARAIGTPDFSLGWELEAIRASRVTPSGVIRERDGSVGGQGLEYKISSEYVTRISESLEALRELTADPELHVDRSCGFHVHMGLAGRVSPLLRQQWAGNFVLLARAVEESAFSSVPESRRTNSYCRRWAGNNTPVASQRYSASKYSNSPARYQWVNVVEMFRPSGIGTVEIRLLGNTRRYAYLLGWIGACHAMARSAWALTQDPSAYAQESLKLINMFNAIRERLLRPSSNQEAYANAVHLGYENIRAMQSNSPQVQIERLISLANATENARSERITNEARAHALALEIQIGLCHAEALEEHSRRQAHEAFERERAERRERDLRTASAITRNATRPVVTVQGLMGFNPDAFTIS